MSCLQCKILTLEKFGMLVSVTQNIRGLVTTLHFADILLKHPEKKLKDGKEITCRVRMLMLVMMLMNSNVDGDGGHSPSPSDGDGDMMMGVMMLVI